MSILVLLFNVGYISCFLNLRQRPILCGLNTAVDVVNERHRKAFANGRCNLHRRNPAGLSVDNQMNAVILARHVKNSPFEAG